MSSPPIRVALATCRNLPGWEVDDAPLRDAFRAAGAIPEDIAWDDPAARWADYAAVLIRTTWDYTARPAAFVAWSRAVAADTLLLNPPEVVAWNTDKGYLRQLEAAGVPVIPTIWIEAGETPGLAARLVGTGWTRAFIKPVVGATAEGTLPFTVDAEGLAGAEVHAAGLLRHRGILLQPFLERVMTEGEVSMIFVGGDFAHGVRKVPVPGDYRVQDDFGAHDEPWTPTPAEIEVGRRAIAATGFDPAYGRVDLIPDAEGVLRLTELELVEPSLFFRHGPGTARRLAKLVLEQAAAGRPR